MLRESCQVAIIGAGNMARAHLHAFRDIPGVTVSGIYSRTRSRAESLAREYDVKNVADSIAELNEKSTPDLVVAAVSVLSLSSTVRACMQWPWTILMEKPPGYNLEDAEEMARAATALRRKVLVGLNRRFLSSTRAALADLDSIPSRRFIHVQDQQDPEQAALAGHPSLVVDNWMYANSIHLIDYFHVFGRGSVKRVRPLVPWKPKRVPVVLAQIEFDSGDIGLYEGIWGGPGPWAVTVSTPEKRWEMRPLETASYQARGARTQQRVEMSEWDRDFKPGFRLQAEMSVAAALGQPSVAPSLPEALKTMHLIHEIFT